VIRVRSVRAIVDRRVVDPCALFFFSKRRRVRFTIGRMTSFSSRSGVSRRRFLTITASALAAPTIIPGSALGADGAVAPSERITMGAIGWGMQGPGNTGAFMNHKDCQVVAVCDLDKNHLAAAANAVNRKYGIRTARPTTITGRSWPGKTSTP